MYAYTVEYYCLKKNEILTHPTTRISPEDVTLSEVSQSQKV